MCNLKLVLIVLLLACGSANAQEVFSSQPAKRGEYGWVLYASGGGGYYVSNSGVPDHVQSKVSNLSRVLNLRLMWHPDHLLNVGIETGYMTFYTYSFTDDNNTSGKVKLEAIPLLVEWNMAVTKRLNLFAGSGVYFLRTNLDYRGSTLSNKVSIGWMAAASYIQPLGKTTGLGAEIKWMNAAETSNGIVSGQLQLVWKFLSW